MSISKVEKEKRYEKRSNKKLRERHGYYTEVRLWVAFAIELLNAMSVERRRELGWVFIGGGYIERKVE